MRFFEKTHLPSLLTLFAAHVTLLAGEPALNDSGVVPLEKYFVRVNFQTAGAAVPAGYRADTGKAYGPREGFSFGWNKSIEPHMRNRNNTLSPDQRYDTFAYLRRENESFTWELAVPNGNYDVRVVAGDPSTFESSYGIDAEGVKVISGRPTSSMRWLDGTASVTVKDGRLTITNRPETLNNTICFIEVMAKAPLVENAAPHVAILEPRNAFAYVAGRDVPVRFSAADPDGYITHGALLVDGREVASERRDYLVPPPPGEKAIFELVWKNATAGAHKITATASDDRGKTGASEPINVLGTTAPSELPVVTIGETDSEAIESDPKNTGVLKVIRRGNLEHPLTVFYEAGGSALNGVDYEKLPGVVTIPARESTAAIHVLPVPDKALEGNETVMVTLTAARSDAPPAYVIGNPRSGTVTIFELPPTAGSAVLRITRPHEGQVFNAPAEIPIEAVAIDPRGYINRVEFHANNQRVGVSEIVFIRAPDPGEPIHHSFLWKGVPLGNYVITARAVDSSGRVVISEPVQIQVKNAEHGLVATRNLPESYAAGIAFTVEIRITPPPRTVAFAVEENLPDGWNAVTQISDEGVLDRAHGAVKFGPFYDDRVRTLRYTVTPPAASRGDQVFSGRVAMGGQEHRIGGDMRITAELTHPADLPPADHRIVLAEAVNYGAAWKLGQRWPDGPHPIPASYATRAASIWRQGENYRYDPRGGSAPLWWVVTGITEEDDKASVNPPARHELMSVNPGNSAIRRIQALGANRLRVEITMETGSEVAAAAIEEHPPMGVSVSNLDSSGVFDPASRTLRWGPFHEPGRRTMSYEIAATGSVTPAKFTGILSIDGMNSAIRNPGESVVPPSSGSLSVATRLSDGSVVLNITGEAGKSYVIEASSDLESWEALGHIGGVEESRTVLDNSAPGSVRFYRLKTLF